MNTSSLTHQQAAVQLSSHPPTTSHSSPLHLAPPFPDRRVQASIKASQPLSVQQQQQQEVVFDYSFSPNRRSGSLTRSDLLSAAHPGLKAELVLCFPSVVGQNRHQHLSRCLYVLVDLCSGSRLRESLRFSSYFGDAAAEKQTKPISS